MQIFIDEGGNFVPAVGFSVVCSLALPHKSVGPVRREVERVSQSWPRRSGELKGGLLDVGHLKALVDILYRHDGLLHGNAINVARESDADTDHHKQQQCEGITKYLTPEFHPNYVKEVWELRHTLERMPNQLYRQCVLMSELVSSVLAESAMYFAQRRPRELASFEWTIDAKDPLRISTQEKWWRDTLGALLESRGRYEPMPFVADAGFNYHFFNQNFAMEKELWSPDGSREKVEGVDIKKAITEHVSFIDSRCEVLLQVVDILASFLRRLLGGTILGEQASDDVSRCLGSLMIVRNRQGRQQSLQFVTLSPTRSSEKKLDRAIGIMNEAGRVMMKPVRGSAA